uniref:CcmD family protein n=1 Tax=Fundidesulfovibrio putealis TaxID=270496 RepID=A0A7C4EJ74_9BACT
MGKESYLLAANVVVWIGLCGYLAFVATRQKRLERRLKHLETLNDD